MEGRLMLAATWLDGAIEFAATQFSFEVYNRHLGAANGS
jgi:hypothetical protein